MVVWFLLFFCLQHSEEERTILVNSTIKSKSCTFVSETWSCPNLQSAFAITINESRVILVNDQVLHNRIYNLSNVGNVLLTAETNVSITCENQSALLFDSVERLFIANLTIDNCGGVVYSSSRLDIAAAVHVLRSRHITMTKTIISRSHGYALFLHESPSLLLRDITIENNTLYEGRPGLRSGGGILIKQTSFNDSIQVVNSTFQNNTGENSRNGKRAYDETAHPFGRGAGLSVFFAGGEGHSQLNVSSCMFSKNVALWGAGLFVAFTEHSTHNQLTVGNGTTFRKNSAIFHGGGARVVSTHTNTTHNNSLTFDGCRFQRNAAGFGGAFSHYRTVKIPRIGFNSFKSCQFINNEAGLGAAIYMADVAISFRNVTFIRNNQREKKDRGTVYAYNSELFFSAQCSFINNTVSGLVLDNTRLYVFGRLMFTGNRGNMGGALSLFGKSQIKMQVGGRLMMDRNKAYRGGAIYVKLYGPRGASPATFGISGYTCFFHWRGGSVEFGRNNATVDGRNDVFASTLGNCKNIDQHINTTFIITDPVNITIVNVSQWKNHYAGETFEPEIILKDERSNNVSRTVNLHLENQFMTSELLKLVTNNQMKLKYKSDLFTNVTTKPFKSESLELFVSFGNIRSNIVSKISLTHCPFAYTLKNGECRCLRTNSDLRGLICELNGTVSITTGLYTNVTQNNIKYDNETTVTCPRGYCKKYNAHYHHLDTKDSDKQCVPGRSGYACAQCSKGHTVGYLTSKCYKNCNLAYGLAYLLVYALIIFVIVCFVVVFFNVCIYNTWINVALYFYQVLQYHIPVETLRSNNPLFTFLGMVNLEGIYHKGETILGFCLFPNMNDLEKELFVNYIVPICAFFTLLFIKKCQVFRNKLFSVQNGLRKKLGFEEKTSDDLSTVMALVCSVLYSVIVRISFSIFRWVKKDGDDTMIYLFAVQKYLQGAVHVSAFVVALLFLVAALVVPALFTCNKLRNCVNLEDSEAFLCVFHRKISFCRIFFAFYYYARFLHMVNSVLLPYELPYRLSITNTLSAIILIIFLQTWPYQNTYTNHYNAMNLFILCLLSNLRALNQREELDNILFTWAVWIPLAVVMIRWVYLGRCIFRKLLKSVCSKFGNCDGGEEPDRKTDDDNQSYVRSTVGDSLSRPL